MTELEAVNRAFILLGVAPQSNLNNDVHAARIASRSIDLSRRAVLAEFPWTFSLRLAALAIGGTPAPGWINSYTYPNDVAVLWDIYREIEGDHTVHWELYDRDIERIKYQTNGTNIFTNHAPAFIEYGIDLPLSEFPVILKEAVVHKVAADMAGTLTGSEQISISMLRRYMGILNQAKMDLLSNRNIKRIAAQQQAQEEESQ